MKRILTGLFVLLFVFSLCTTVMTVSVSAADRSAASVSESATGETETEKSFGDRLAEAGMVTLEGMGMVFAVLALLWGVLEIFRVVMQKSEKKKTEKSAKQTVVSEATEQQPGHVNAETVTAESTGDDGELIAAITAAVAAYLASEEGAAYAGGFRVVSFRRSGNGSTWNKNN